MSCNHPWDWSCIDCVERSLNKFEKQMEEEKMAKCVKDSGLECEDEIPWDCRTTEDEKRIMFHLVCAFNIFNELDKQHPDEEAEFRHALHDMQRIISMRILRRLMPTEFTGGKA